MGFLVDFSQDSKNVNFSKKHVHLHVYECVCTGE